MRFTDSDSHGATHDGLSDTYANYHDYTIGMYLMNLGL